MHNTGLLLWSSIIYVTTKCHGGFEQSNPVYRGLYKVKYFFCHCKYKNCERVMQITVIVPAFRAELFGRFRCWLGEVLGVQLESTVDISCARYEYTGELCRFCRFSLHMFAICKLLSSF